MVTILILILSNASFLHALDKSKVYKFAVDIDYPPFSYINEKTGEMEGFDVDISKAVCKTIGIQCEVLGVTFDEIIPLIVSGDLDVGAAGFAYTAERAELIIFTEKYYRSNSIFVQTDQDFLEITPAAINGLTVAVQRGTIQEGYLRATFKDSIIILLCNNLLEAMEAVSSKRADLAFADGIATYTYLRSDAGKHLDIAGDPIAIGDDDGLMVLNKKSRELCDSINNAIKLLRSTGEYDLINLKYFDYNIY
ncbi:MAG: transporter substrate-binding domain-containing protein [Deltaproteobacteria bacterium]|nr:transporter substrate-binding domain-containing protein [Deltaproteobacteria bacterium]